MKRTFATLLTLAACTAAGAETAAANDGTVRTDYHVVVEGEAYYNRADVTPTEDGPQPHQEDEQFKFRSEMPGISFFDQVGGDATRSHGSATGVRGHVFVQHPGGTTLTCDGSTITDFRAGWLDANFADGHTVYTVRTIDAVQMSMPCDHGFDYQKRFEAGGAALGDSMWDAKFTLPGGSVGQEEFRIPVSGGAKGEACPGHNVETTICELSWTADVIFKRTGWEDVPKDDDELNVPIVKPEPQPQPAPQPQPVEPAFETLPGAKLGTSSLTVPVTCAAGCAGTATVTLAGGRARAAAVKPLARKAFTVAPGATKRIAITIPKRARKAVKRAGAVKVTLAVTPTGGARVTKRLTVRR